MSPPPDPALPGLDGFVKHKRPRKESTKKLVTVGAVSVPVYKFKDRYAIIYREGGKKSKRKTLSFKLGEKAAAFTKARELCLDIARGRIKADKLTGDELLLAVAARDLLAKRGLTLDAAARDVASAHDLTGGAGIMEIGAVLAASSSVGRVEPSPRRHPARDDRGEKSGRSRPEYLRNVNQRLKKFAAKFELPIVEISAREIRAYLKELPVGKRTRNNVLADVVMLFGFAQAARDLPEDRKHEAEKVGRAKLTKTPARGIHSRRPISLVGIGAAGMAAMDGPRRVRGNPHGGNSAHGLVGHPMAGEGNFHPPGDRQDRRGPIRAAPGKSDSLAAAAPAWRWPDRPGEGPPQSGNRPNVED